MEREPRRGFGRIIDVELLRRRDDERFVHRFVEAIVSTRETEERFLFLRSGDEAAIAAAADGSHEILEEVTIVEEVPEDDPLDPPADPEP